MMGTLRYWIAVGCVTLGLIGGLCASALAQGTVPGHVLVRLSDDTGVGSLGDDYGATIENELLDRKLYLFQVPNAADEDAFITKLGSNANVLYAEKEPAVELPEVHGAPYALSFDAGPRAKGYLNQHAYIQAHIGNAHKLSLGTGITIAVLDTGVNTKHPALLRHCLTGQNCLQPALPPAELADGTTNIARGHGTMIAGIISKIAPGAKIMPVRVLSADGKGGLMAVLTGLHYAVTHGAKIIPMSFGSDQPSEALQDALGEIQDAGIVVVASAGNGGTNLAHYPAAWPGILGVASLDPNNVKSPFSNFGTYISISAPGRNIRSTFWTGGYATWSGTSFAAPFV